MMHLTQRHFMTFQVTDCPEHVQNNNSVNLKEWQWFLNLQLE